MDFELTWLIIFYLNQKWCSVVMHPNRPSYQRTVRWTTQALMEPVFESAVAILQRRKVVRCVKFYWTMGYFEQGLQRNALSGPQVCWKLSICQYGVSFVTLCCLDGQILVQKFIEFDHICITGNLSVLAVRNVLRVVSLFMFCVCQL